MVMLMTASQALLDARQELHEDVGDGRRPAVLRVARMQMQDRGAGLGRGDRIARDLVGRDRQVRRHVGVWIEPVTAQVMITLRDGRLRQPRPCRPPARVLVLCVGGERHQPAVAPGLARGERGGGTRARRAASTVRAAPRPRQGRDAELLASASIGLAVARRVVEERRPAR